MPVDVIALFVGLLPMRKPSGRSPKVNLWPRLGLGAWMCLIKGDVLVQRSMFNTRTWDVGFNFGRTSRFKVHFCAKPVSHSCRREHKVPSLEAWP